MNYVCAEKSFGLSAGSHSTKTHLKPSGAVGCSAFAGVDHRCGAASLMPSRIARLSTSYVIQIDAIKKMNNTASSSIAALCSSISKFLNSTPFSVFVAADFDSAQRGAAQGEAGEAPASDTPREAHPVGNTGTTSQKPTSRHGAAIPAVFSGVAHG